MKLFNSIYNIKVIDSLSDKNSIIHRISPIVKLIVTLLYVITIISFDRYEISGLIIFMLYPIIVLILGELPVKPIMKSVLLAQIFIFFLGITNLFFDKELVKIGSFYITSGTIALISMLMKGILTVSSMIILVATTSIYDICLALRILKIPKIFILQIMLLYRYIFVLSDEAIRMVNAYEMRAPKKKGIEFKEWGSFAGTLLLRAYDRGEQVYMAMKLRGFNGEYRFREKNIIKIEDYIYLSIWLIFCSGFRWLNISLFLERMFS